jgi:c-di-GMP-binding flagellar brake protein YcgR
MANSNNMENRRRFKRILFSAEEDVTGIVSLSESDDETLAFKIADLSAGGLRFLIQKIDSSDVQTGDTLILKKIDGKSQLDFVSDMQLDVRWIMDDPRLEHAMIGCEFSGISDSDRARIEQFVESETPG